MFGCRGMKRVVDSIVERNLEDASAEKNPSVTRAFQKLYHARCLPLHDDISFPCLAHSN